MFDHSGHGQAKMSSIRFCHRSEVMALLCLGITIIFCACEPRIATHGFMPREELVSQLSPGEQDKRLVSQVMGTPSSIGSFDDNVWYYITQRTEKQAFFKPQVIEQQVLVLFFDEKEILQSIEKYNLEEAQLIEPLDDKTPTVGRKLTILQQLFGNLGRFRHDGEENNPY